MMTDFTIENLRKLVEKIEQKPTIYMNSRTREAVLNHLDFEPANIEVENYMPDNQAIVITKEQMDKMRKGFFNWSM